MTPDQTPKQTGTDADATARPAATELEWRRRQRLAAVFGDVLPDTTGDERDPGGPPRESVGDRWLRDQVPPHHG